MKKPIFLLLLLFILVITGCSNSSSSANSKEAKIKVGIRSSELRTWEFIKEKAKKQGLDIELVNFSSAYDPNQALAEGEIDVNAFQHVAYLDSFNQKNGTDIVPIGTTIIAPLGLYSEKYKSLKDIPNGAQIAVPNDPSNWGRALVLLQEADLITVVEGFDGNGGEDKIKSNPKNLKIVPVDSASTPRVMQDTAASIINNGVAVEAGLSLKDALIHENKTAKPYINVIAARKKDQDKVYLKKLVKVYQSKSTAAFIKKTYKGNYIPTFISLKELNAYKDTYKTK
ncbi:MULTISPECIES: MetQ/NlpA family ABC transporter substrate-binding protein [Priestia]|jgi:D-methionine transport system substrate-binding protein|uniref:Lipoprotein n=2 Tax=Priestia megaterium TaxID=1404 RepID=A0AAE5P5Y5_PRIMG|nr:MetQ/NlpA family ABC transporter substrate-binding protein [Priestia megaterium]MBV6735985.1 MetQ/NlpA family ABC transporter substrate-binding protein [Priestia megaterium]MCR8864574.1 MetQ/NlpA family ABC transporter substrate-binding protein [Priestia megaterium]MDC7779415.1 MetQ/NlpA family ABC transporter substrate-binding protein [Priestia megaterium]MDN3228869.1 MetQ/NlpA family ABC transporter substrate-binding protein [Priestia megaterium]MDR0128258.1 MetQ/NlpA family ABC transport